MRTFVCIFMISFVILGLTKGAPKAQTLDMAQMTGEVWGNGNRTLFVILHGDGGPGRYDAFAARMANTHSGMTVVTMNRPGYRYKGKRSKGRGGYSVGDQYTNRNNRYVAEALIAMRNSLKPRKMIVMGHSGGAGQLGSIIGQYHNLVDTAILLSCPCDVQPWRRHRTRQKGRSWKGGWPKSQSPLDFVSSIGNSTKVHVVVGANDTNTLPKFSEIYVSAAQSVGKRVIYTKIPQAGHGWKTLEPNITALLAKEAK